MRVLLQRVSRAAVRVDGQIVGAIDGPGLLALVGVTHTDGPAQVEWAVRKIGDLRLLADEQSVVEAGGAVLVVSQFTLYGDARKGRRPTWSAAAPGHVAEPLVEAITAGLRNRGITVETGRFGAQMQVELTNEGPCSLQIEDTAT